MTEEKTLTGSETGTLTLLIAAYLTLNTSLNLLNKVRTLYFIEWYLFRWRYSLPRFSSHIPLHSFIYPVRAVVTWSLWFSIPSRAHLHTHGF